MSTLIRRRNKIEALMDEMGEWMYDNEKLKNMGVDYYRMLFAAKESSGGEFIEGKLPAIDTELSTALKSGYSMQDT